MLTIRRGSGYIFTHLLTLLENPENVPSHRSAPHPWSDSSWYLTKKLNNSWYMTSIDVELHLVLDVDVGVDVELQILPDVDVGVDVELSSTPHPCFIDVK